MTPAQFWDIEMQNQRNAMQMQQQANLAAQQQQREMVSDIGSALGQFANQYAENKAMDAKAKSYDKIGEIIGSSMFSGNDAAMNALSELKKSKDPREKIMGYEALLSFVGPYSNFMMANRNAGIRENQQALTAAMPNLRAQQNAAAQVAAGQGRVTTLPSNINPDAIP